MYIIYNIVLCNYVNIGCPTDAFVSIDTTQDSSGCAVLIACRVSPLQKVEPLVWGVLPSCLPRRDLHGDPFGSYGHTIQRQGLS